MGRPSSYTPELAAEICDKIATTRMGLEEVIESLQVPDSEKPSQRAVYRWLEANEEFRQSYSRARELQGDYLVDLAVVESFKPRIGTIMKSTPKGPEETISDNVDRSRLIVSTLLKRAGQLSPKKYGDKLGIEHSGELTLADRMADARKRAGR